MHDCGESPWEFTVRHDELLTELCIYQNKLPQGAPTSPYIANLVLIDFDIETGK